MEGPYRDLGSGFARLTGPEGARRSPSGIPTVEAAARELVRNSLAAGARNVFVATSLRSRRYRTLTVIDDGTGIPEPYLEMIFEPGVTTRHLDPTVDTHGSHGSGLSLYHIRESALRARVLSPRNPTVIQATFDTHSLPERTLQSTSRHSDSNLRATLTDLAIPATNTPPPSIYLGSNSRITALIYNHKRIIPIDEDTPSLSSVRGRVREWGMDLSERTVRRVLAGEVRPAKAVEASGMGRRGERLAGSGREAGDGPVLRLAAEDLGKIRSILGEVARSSYLELYELKSESRPGLIVLRARVYEPEDEYG